MVNYYICHYCIDYKTDSLSDMYKHFKRKNKCKCSTLYSYEEAEILTKNRKYLFSFDIKNLLKDDYLYIITHYTEKNNNIHNNFKDIILNNDKIDTQIKNNQIITTEEIKNNEIITTEEIKNNEIITIDEIKDRTCPLCERVFNSRFNLKRHLLYNQTSCQRKQLENELFKKTKEDSIKKIEKAKEVQSINNTYIGTQNNNNILNNNNNTQNNTYNFSMNDFVNDSYDISHLNDDFYAKKDFFLYPVFLDAVMQNKKNHNIFFAENEAIIYTDNELSKMDSDKAGYLILDKLSQSVDQLFYKNDKETQDYYSYITKYYHVIRGHYKHDTICKDYDVNTRSFIYTANSRSFRGRDKYLNKIIGSINRVKNSTRENMNINLHEIKDIQKLNPNIEDYCSVRNRYKDLKDKNSF